MGLNDRATNGTSYSSSSGLCRKEQLQWPAKPSTESARETADAVAHEAAQEAYDAAYEEAYQEAYDEAFAQAYEKPTTRR